MRREGSGCSVVVLQQQVAMAVGGGPLLSKVLRASLGVRSKKSHSAAGRAKRKPRSWPAK